MDEEKFHLSAMVERSNSVSSIRRAWSWSKGLAAFRPRSHCLALVKASDPANPSTKTPVSREPEASDERHHAVTIVVPPIFPLLDSVGFHLCERRFGIFQEWRLGSSYQYRT